MIKSLTEHISYKLIKNKIIDDEEQEFYKYGLELLICKCIFYIVVLLISLITHTFLLSLIFTTLYLSLRQYTGGYHCKTAGGCLVFSTVIYLLMLFHNHVSIGNEKSAIIILSVISFIILFIFAPDESENNPLTAQERKKYRNRSIALSALYLASVTIGCATGCFFLYFPEFWSLTADAVLIILSKKGGEKHEEYRS